MINLNHQRYTVRIVAIGLKRRGFALEVMLGDRIFLHLRDVVPLVILAAVGVSHVKI